MISQYFMKTASKSPRFPNKYIPVWYHLHPFIAAARQIQKEMVKIIPEKSWEKRTTMLPCQKSLLVFSTAGPTSIASISRRSAFQAMDKPSGRYQPKKLKPNCRKEESVSPDVNFGIQIPENHHPIFWKAQRIPASVDSCHSPKSMHHSGSRWRLRLPWGNFFSARAWTPKILPPFCW